MADLFTRLVSGPAAAVPLAPRVPALHEPLSLSNVDDEVEMVLAPSEQPEPAAVSVQPVEMATPPSPPLGEEAMPPSAPSPPPSPSTLTLSEVVVREVRGEIGPVAEPVDLGGKVPPQQHKSSKISPGLRPRDPEPALSLREQRAQREQRSPRTERPQGEPQEPARTTVRIEIGRIEIRAPRHPQPMPAVARNQVPEGLTLADYLRGHDGRPR